MEKNKFNIKDYLPYIAIGGGFYIIYKIFLEKSDTTAASEQVVDMQDKKIAELQKKYNKSYPIDYYNTLANSIYDNIKYSGAADDYKAAFGLILKIKNPLDLALVTKAYGTRQRYFFGLPIGEKEDFLTSISKELRSEVIYNPFGKTKVEQINEWFTKNNIPEQI